MTDDGRTTLTGPPPGWYEDPQGVQRWWDGAAWTTRVAATEPVAVPAVPAMPTEPAKLLSAPIAVPARSMDLLPAATPAKSRGGGRQLPKLSVPQLSPLKWAGVGAGLVGVVGAAFFFTRPGDDEAGAVPKPVAAAGPVLGVKAGAVLTAKQAAATLPAVSVLGAGWLLDPKRSINMTNPGNNLNVLPANCGKILNRLPVSLTEGKPVSQSARSYSSKTAGLIAGVGVVSYAAPVPAAAIDVAKGLLPACAKITSGQIAASITSVTFPAYGQGAVEVKMLIPIAKTNVVTDVLVVRQGHNVVLVQLMGQQSSPTTMATLIRSALGQLPH